MTESIVRADQLILHTIPTTNAIKANVNGSSRGRRGRSAAPVVGKKAHKATRTVSWLLSHTICSVRVRTSGA